MNKIDLRKNIKDEMQQKNWGAALSMLQKYSGLVHDDFELTWNKGWAFFKTKKYHSALIEFHEAAALDPANALADFGIGMTQLELRRFEDAVAALSACLTKKELVSARLGLAVAYMEQGRDEMAEKVHLDGLNLKPDSSERWKFYSAFLSDVGRELESRAARKKSQQLATN